MPEHRREVTITETAAVKTITGSQGPHQPDFSTEGTESLRYCGFAFTCKLFCIGLPALAGVTCVKQARVPLGGTGV